MSAQVLPRKVYFTVYAALFVLLILTVAVSYFDLGAFNMVLAMTIAIGKMLLIILYFMHVRYSSRMTWVFAAAGFLWLLILLEMTMVDYLTRHGWLAQ